MRKIIQVAATATQVDDRSYSTLVVLCDDGTLLQYSPRRSPPWTKFPDVPEPEVTLDEVDPTGNPPEFESLDKRPKLKVRDLEESCCANERRNINGGCDTCGDLCF